MLPSSKDRVPQSTSDEVNEMIEDQTLENIEFYGRMGADALNSRLQKLDYEWDIERAIESNAATLALTGVLLGAFVDRRFLLLSGVVGGFLLQHSLQGWCPPVPLFRRLGFRTAQEIERERYALKAVRGDFEMVSNAGSQLDMAQQAYQAVKK